MENSGQLNQKEIQQLITKLQSMAPAAPAPITPAFRPGSAAKPQNKRDIYRRQISLQWQQKYPGS